MALDTPIHRSWHENCAPCTTAANELRYCRPTTLQTIKPSDRKKAHYNNLGYILEKSLTDADIHPLPEPMEVIP